MPLVTADSDAPKSQAQGLRRHQQRRGGHVGRQHRHRGALKAANVTKGKVALFVGRIDMQNAIERKQGIDETLGKMPGIEILPGVPGPHRSGAGQEERRGRPGALSRTWC
jgi:ABC-type sugar transport system substrate-binding protein